MAGAGDVCEVVRGDAVVGTLRLVDRDDETSVRDVDLGGEAALVPELVRLLADRARARGLRSVAIDVRDDDPTAATWLAQGLAVAAVRMRRDLTTAPVLPTGAPVRLEPMTPEGFASFLTVLVDDYAAERVLSGESPQRAAAVAAEQLGALLPDGVASPEQHLFTVRADDEPVGRLWLGTERPLVWVYEVAIDPAHRRRGLGAAAVRAAEAWARERGAPAIGLNVFGQNTAARSLYAGLG